MAREKTELLILNRLLEKPVMSSPQPKSYTLEASIIIIAPMYLQLGAAPPDHHTCMIRSIRTTRIPFLFAN